MARGKKGRPIHGWLIVDKPAGRSSAAMVASAKRAFDARKAGHAGTLDPPATGLLAIAFGEATKTVPYVTEAQKCYAFTLRWGVATTTDDAEGEPIARCDLRPDRAAICAALPAFTGDINQIPPQISAVKLAGVRAYERVRAGETVALGARPLHVAELTLTDQPDDDHASFRLVCGKGGYVRSIARDLAAVLGTLGHVTALRRLWSGPFDLTASTPGDMLENAGGALGVDRLLAVSAGLCDLVELPCTPEGAARLRNGNPVAVAASAIGYGQTAWASYAGEPVAVGIYRAGMLHPTRVFRFD
ncbi:MAG: tRNA pseudouridine(55) synthase TruB [Pseudomonadota bacterium]